MGVADRRDTARIDVVGEVMDTALLLLVAAEEKEGEEEEENQAEESAQDGADDLRGWEVRVATILARRGCCFGWRNASS